MTKEQFLARWGSVYTPNFKPDLDALISHEIAKAQEVKLEDTQPQPEMCESDAIDYILTNKLNWKKLGDNRMFAIGFARTGASFRVSFVEYHRVLSGSREIIIHNIDLTEWQPVDTSIKQPEKPFDRERFERLFCAVVASGRTERWEQDFKFTEEALAKLDAYYAEKQGGNNG